MLILDRILAVVDKYLSDVTVPAGETLKVVSDNLEVQAIDLDPNALTQDVSFNSDKQASTLLSN